MCNLLHKIDHNDIEIKFNKDELKLKHNKWKHNEKR